VITTYAVIRLDPDPQIGSPAIRLVKAGGSSYDLIRTEHGWTCECQDWHNRRQESGRMCKHLKAALNTGILVARQGDAFEGPDYDAHGV
jgi:hypothetical protein